MSDPSPAPTMITLDELFDAIKANTIPMDSPKAGPWGTWGPGSGDCGHRHRLFRTAHECAYVANMRVLRYSNGHAQGDRRPYLKGTDPKARHERYLRQSR